MLIIIFVITVLATATRLAISTDSTGRSDLSVAMALLLIAVGLLTGTQLLSLRSKPSTARPEPVLPASD